MAVTRKLTINGDTYTVAVEPGLTMRRQVGAYTPAPTIYCGHSDARVFGARSVIRKYGGTALSGMRPSTGNVAPPFRQRTLASGLLGRTSNSKVELTLTHKLCACRRRKYLGCTSPPYFISRRQMFLDVRVNRLSL